jgi:hypothetical protein
VGDPSFSFCADELEKLCVWPQSSHTKNRLLLLFSMKLCLYAAMDGLSNAGRPLIFCRTHKHGHLSGIGNVLGNKGGSVASIFVNQTPLCFVSAHLVNHIPPISWL